jgi:hypothetical protein
MITKSKTMPNPENSNSYTMKDRVKMPQPRIYSNRKEADFRRCIKSSLSKDSPRCKPLLPIRLSSLENITKIVIRATKEARQVITLTIMT